MTECVGNKDALRLIIEETSIKISHFCLVKLVKYRLVYQKKKTLSTKNNTSALFPAR